MFEFIQFLKMEPSQRVKCSLNFPPNIDTGDPRVEDEALHDKGIFSILSENLNFNSMNLNVIKKVCG